jgi:hypothetical protein
MKLELVLALLLLACPALLIPPQALSQKDKTKPGQRVTLFNSWPPSRGDDAFKKIHICLQARPVRLVHLLSVK